MAARSADARANGAGGKRPAPLLPERLLAKLWKAREGRTLRAADGRRVRALYAGRPAPGHGPDFQDAVVLLDGERRMGGVELHRKPSDWRAHGHDADPAYDGVILHVVASAEDGGPDLPVVELRARKRGAAAEPALMERAAREGTAGLRQMLARSGLARFRERAEAAAQRAGEAGPEQALQEAAFEALGYAENRAPFLRLARDAPAAELRRIERAAPKEERAAALERFLLGAARLDAPVAPQCLGAEGGRRAQAGEAGENEEGGEAARWRTAGVRPANHPRRRIAGAAALLARVADEGLFRACARALADGPSALEGLFAVSGAGGALIGAARAREIAVNAALPALAAAGDGDAEGVYLRFPAPPENALTKEARRLAGAAGMRLTACEQIGLIRLYRRSVGGR